MLNLKCVSVLATVQQDMVLLSLYYHSGSAFSWHTHFTTPPTGFLYGLLYQVVEIGCLSTHHEIHTTIVITTCVVRLRYGSFVSKTQIFPFLATTTNYLTAHSSALAVDLNGAALA